MPHRSSSKIPATSSDKPQSGQRAKSDPPQSKFELIAELGRGGMATVYLARAKKRPEKLFVLKQLRAELAENPEFLAMFLEEARLAGKLQHPNIVETYEVGQDAGTYYIAMEYLEGLSLQAVLTKFGWKGEFTFPLQVFVLIEALKALEQAYTQRDDDGTPLKIVHRDVSPPNIIITFGGQVKLVDFGIAKAANSHVETRTGLIKGKLTYMAPEQAQSGDVDSRTDIYSIGVMLWQAAAGTRRWKGVENTEVLKRLHNGDIVESPRAKKNGLPAIVDDIVVRAIDPDPEKRHRSASAFRATLESLLREMDVEIAAKDLIAFMTKHFGDVRQRAADVMKARIAELDETPSSEMANKKKNSSAAMRAAASPATAPQKKTDATRKNENKPQVGGAAASLAEKISRNVQPKKQIAEQIDNTSTQASPTARRQGRPLLVGVAGLAIAAALAFQGVRVYRNNVHATPTSAPATQVTTAIAPADAPAPSAPPSVAPATISSVEASDPALASTNLNDVQPTAPHARHHRHSQPTGAPTPIPATTPTATAISPMPAGPVTAPSSAPADSTHPSLDKQDPWKSSGTKTDKSDPWTGQPPSSQPQDPWGR